MLDIKPAMTVYALVIEHDWGMRGSRKETHFFFPERMSAKDTENWLKENHPKYLDDERCWKTYKEGKPYTIVSYH